MSNFSNISLNKLLHQVRQILKQESITISSTQNTSASVNSSQAGLNSQLQAGNLIRDGNFAPSKMLQQESLRLNSQEVSMFIKETMKLPQEIRLLLLMLALESSPADMKQMAGKTLREIITQNLNQLAVSPEKIQKMLDKNMQNATEIMMKMLQNSTINQTRSGQQIMEMMSSLGKLGEKIKASPADALETLVLLYIPWYPLAAQQKIDLSFEQGLGEGEEESSDISLVIYLQTNTLGRFKIMVSEVDPLQVVIKLMHEEIARHFAKEIESNTNKMLAKEGLPAAIFETQVMQDPQSLCLPLSGQNHADRKDKHKQDDTSNSESTGFQRATRQEDRREISIQPGRNISLLVINTAYTLARFIFETDEANQPLQKQS